jgi:hypothetical protein
LGSTAAFADMKNAINRQQTNHLGIKGEKLNFIIGYC